MFKYLYVDDELGTGSEQEYGTPISLAAGLSNETLFVEYIQVMVFLDEGFIERELPKYDGLLLDLRLDEIKNSEGKGSVFTATELAQHIRTLVTKKVLRKDMPIVLFSTDDKVKQVYSTDLTSHNLFDRYIEKHKTPENAINKLVNLAKGYKDIQTNKELFQQNSQKDLFGLLMNLDDLAVLDERIYSRFYEDTLNIPNHEYAQMILKELIYVDGPLVNEYLLAARLGIDMVKSAESWRTVKELFSPAIYEGVFSEGWQRWWLFKVEEIFRSFGLGYLQSLNAGERVKVLNDKLNVATLVQAEPIKHSVSSYFDTVCKALKKPLDSMEGFRVYSSKEPKAWQKYEYVSLNAVVERMHIENKDIRIMRADQKSLELAIEGLESDETS